MSLIPPYAYFIALSFLSSLLVYKGQTMSYLKLFPPFLLLTLVIEIYSSYLSTIARNNMPVYNFFSVIEFCFYLFVISLIIRNNKIRKVIRISALVYALVAVINILYIQKIRVFHTATYSGGCLLVVAFCIYYFYELFRSPHSGKLEYNPAFWICTGLLFFYCCGFPLYAFIHYWANSVGLVISSFAMITTVLNIFLYCLFTIAFLCTRVRSFTLSR